MRADRSPDRGFTLFELVIVLGIMGLMFGMVFLKLDGLVPSNRLKSGARELASRLEQARNYAIVSARPIHFEYDLANSVYRYYVPFELSDDGKEIKGEGETVVMDWEALPDTIHFRDILIGDGDPITGGRVTVRFEPRAIATSHIVHLQRATDDANIYSVQVSAILGYVDVSPGDRQPEYVDDDAF